MEAKQMELSSNNGTLKRLGRWFVNYAGQLGFLLILIVVLSFSAPSFLKTNNIINVSRQVSVNMIIACAMTIVLISGGIDLSTGSVMAMSGMVSAYLSFSGFPFVFCALAGILTGVFSGLINGLILANTKLPPFIVTYAMQSILRGIVFVATGAGTIRLENKAYLDFGGSSIGGIPLPVLYMIAVIVIAWLVLGRSKMGRHIYAIGGNPRAAQFAGINIKRIVVFIYSLCGACAALAGLAGALAPGGLLLIITRGREEDEDPGHLPWPLTRAELDTLTGFGLQEVSFERYFDDETPPVRRFRAAYRKP